MIATTMTAIKIITAILLIFFAAMTFGMGNPTFTGKQLFIVRLWVAVHVLAAVLLLIS